MPDAMPALGDALSTQCGNADNRTADPHSAAEYSPPDRTADKAFACLYRRLYHQ